MYFKTQGVQSNKLSVIVYHHFLTKTKSQPIRDAYSSTLLTVPLDWIVAFKVIVAVSCTTSYISSRIDAEVSGVRPSLVRLDLHVCIINQK
jgi:hypothetical protein